MAVRMVDPVTHGLISGYKAGCRCDECREAAATARRQTRENRRREEMVEWPEAWWSSAAACHGRSELFFAPAGEVEKERMERVASAVAICNECPVLGECRGYALRIRERHGVWGGLTSGERRRILRKRGAA